MSATGRLAPRARTHPAPGAVVTLAWGIDLHTGPDGGLHESLAEVELIDPFTERPDLEAVIATEQHGPDFEGDLLVISRSVTCPGDGLRDITNQVAPPADSETAAVHAALDYLGYTGPRQIRLLFTVDRYLPARPGQRHEEPGSAAIVWDAGKTTVLARDAAPPGGPVTVAEGTCDHLLAARPEPNSPSKQWRPP